MTDRPAMMRILSILLFAAALAWPALRNGQAFLMSDTTTYVRGADAAIYRLTDHPTIWSYTYIDRYEPAKHAAVSPTRPVPADPADLPVTITGRSVFYGALLYASCLLGSFWGAVVVQVLLTATAMTLAAETLCRAMGRTTPELAGTIALAALLAISPAGYFAGYMMPDIFLPLGLLALLMIALFWPILTAPTRCFWSLLLLAALLFHNLDIVLISTILLLLIAMRAPIGRRPTLLVVGAIGVALLMQTGVALAVRGLTGAAPVAPPFLAARLIADGPGRDYLLRNCPQAQFALCNHLDRLSTNSDIILWSGDPAKGLFWTATSREKRRIVDEQARFAFAVFAERSGDTLRSTAFSVVDQLGRWGLSEFNYPAFQRASFGEKLPEPVLDRTRHSAAFAETMPTAVISAAAPVMAAAALLLFAGLIRRERKTILLIGGSLLAALLLNALICGAISTPHDRYQMRLVWLPPMLAAMLFLALRRDGRSR